MSRSSRPRAAPRKSPSLPTNLRAFHSGGLWLAVMAMPPCAPSCRTRTCTVGVGTTPRSLTRQPLEARPATTACRTISPEVRGSRPMTTRPPPTQVPKAWAKRATSSGVRESPTTPRTPEMLIFSVGMARIASSDPQALARPVGELLRSRGVRGLRDHAHERLRVRGPDVDPAVGPEDLDPVRLVHGRSLHLAHRLAELLEGGEEMPRVHGHGDLAHHEDGQLGDECGERPAGAGEVLEEEPDGRRAVVGR